MNPLPPLSSPLAVEETTVALAWLSVHLADCMCLSCWPLRSSHKDMGRSQGGERAARATGGLNSEPPIPTNAPEAFRGPCVPANGPGGRHKTEGEPLFCWPETQQLHDPAAAHRSPPFLSRQRQSVLEGEGRGDCQQVQS